MVCTYLSSRIKKNGQSVLELAIATGNEEVAGLLVLAGSVLPESKRISGTQLNSLHEIATSKKPIDIAGFNLYLW